VYNGRKILATLGGYFSKFFPEMSTAVETPGDRFKFTSIKNTRIEVLRRTIHYINFTSELVSVFKPYLFPSILSTAEMRSTLDLHFTPSKV
jgi:hypothetical protein